MSTTRHSGIVSFHNSTALDTERLRAMCFAAVDGWNMTGVTVRIRYSRGADYSGSCYYASRRIFINLGRHLTYPYRMGTHVARAHSTARHWWKPIYPIELADGYEVILFVFLHEAYHWLIKRARRNTRQKESMCDRFAARYLVDHFAATVYDEDNCIAGRGEWDFQDLDGFIDRARIRSSLKRAARRILKTQRIPQALGAGTSSVQHQLLLFTE